MSAEELQKKLKDAYVVSWAEPAPVLVAGLNCSAVMLHSTVLAVPATLCSVKAYEAKLAALNALNSALQKENEQLRDDLEVALEPKNEPGGLLYCQQHTRYRRTTAAHASL